MASQPVSVSGLIDESCPICYEQCVSAVLLSCRHVYCHECLERNYDDNCPLCRMPTVRDGKARSLENGELVEIRAVADLNSGSQTPMSDYEEDEVANLFTRCGMCGYMHFMYSRYGSVRRPWFHCVVCATSHCYKCGGFGVGHSIPGGVELQHEGSGRCFECFLDVESMTLSAGTAEMPEAFCDVVRKACSGGMVHEAVVSRALALVEYVTRSECGVGSDEERLYIKRSVFMIDDAERLRSTFVLYNLYQIAAFKGVLRTHPVHTAEGPALKAARMAAYMFRVYMQLSVSRSVSLARDAVLACTDNEDFVKKIDELATTMTGPMQCTSTEFYFDDVQVRLFQSKADDWVYRRDMRRHYCGFRSDEEEDDDDEAGGGRVDVDNGGDGGSDVGLGV